MNQVSKLETNGSSSSEKDETFVDRINYLIHTCKSASKLARMANVSPSAIRKWKNGVSEPDLSNLKALAKAGNRSVEWLATGKDISGTHHQVNEQTNSYESTPVEWSGFSSIPLYNIEASAGHGSALEDEQIKGGIAFRTDWLRAKGLKEKHLATITARGDSMEPTIKNGDLLLINSLEKEVAGDAIYVIRSEGHLYAKRLQLMFSGELYIKSDNQIYTTQIVTTDKASDLVIVGRVVWIGHEI